MQNFRIYDNYWGWTESGFRSRYGDDVREGSMRCCSGMGEDAWCKNECQFLMAPGIEHVVDGFFPLFGIDCDVENLGCDGDVEDATFEVYCKECAAAMHESRLEREREQEIEIEKRNKHESLERAEREKKQRGLLDRQDNLSDTQFEQQCAQLFRDKGFKAEITPRTNDGGIDILLEKDGKRGAAQCKAWNRPCGVKEVREFYGVVFHKKMTFGYFISKSGYTESAAEFLSEQNLIQRWSVNDLVEHSLRLNSDNFSD